MVWSHLLWKQIFHSECNWQTRMNFCSLFISVYQNQIKMCVVISPDSWNVRFKTLSNLASRHETSRHHRSFARNQLEKMGSWWFWKLSFICQTAYKVHMHLNHYLTFFSVFLSVLNLGILIHRNKCWRNKI